MNMKFIPIVGTISAGKSTFLRAFLGIDVLQTGQTTTTKFVCLIKNSDQISFYHVIPVINDGIIFEKEGEEIKDVGKIQKKIEEINNILNENKGNQTDRKNEIFYMLEIPIKNIQNEELLENAYFMDIPGLNENNATYIEDIFSVITIDDILFEIMVFDSTSIGSDNILKIFEKLNQKNCLKTEDNLYILNKIDKTTGGGSEEIIDYFKQFFYQAFEDEKNEESNIVINISKNYFIPLNSILYQAETKCNEDFYSMLLLELFAYLENANKQEISSFFDYIVKRLENIMKQNEINEDGIDDIDDDSKDMEIIKETIEKINNIQADVTTTTEFTITINLERKKQKKVIKNLYILHKQKKFLNFIHSESFNKLQNIINNYKINDLSCPPSIGPLPIVEEKKEETKKESILNEMNTFLNQQLKGQFSELNLHLNVLSENLLGRKIRISFIGNISVGKSSVLNAIIGENILPTSEKECTYRGVIIKHKNVDDYYLYGTHLEILGDGSINEYYNFKENKEYYCKGKEEIKSRLKCKNNDKNMDEKDAFIVIQGRLKIFDFIKLDEELVNKIEFVDLPGHDRKNNTFNQKQYYNQILQFSNSCIYVNEPKTIDDEDSVIRIRSQYNGDKQKLHPSLRDKFINSCLFLVNKSDTLSNKKEQRKKDEEKIKKSIIEIISAVEQGITQESINISFFSGKCFNEFLEYYNIYIYKLDNNTKQFLKDLYIEYTNNSWNFFKIQSFKDFINKKAEKIEDKLNIELEESKIPSDFYEKLQSAYNELPNLNKRNKKGEKEIINTLYSIKYTINNTDFTNTDYSTKFFENLKDIILYTDKIQNDNLKLSIESFFKTADELFNRNVEKETENEKKQNEERYYLFKDKIIPDCKKLLEQKQNKIIKILENGKKNVLDLINDEINNAEERLKESNKDLKEASSKLENKIKEKIDDMKTRQDNEVNTIVDEIIQISNEHINSYYNSKDLSVSEIDAEKEKKRAIVISLVSSALGAVAAGIGAAGVGFFVASGVAAGTMGVTALTTGVGALFGPLGIVAGLGVGAIIGGISLLVYKLKKTKKYIEALENCKSDIDSKFEDMIINFKKDFNYFKNSLVEELDTKCKVLYKQIDGEELREKWGQIRGQYEVIRDKTKKELKELFNSKIK